MPKSSEKPTAEYALDGATVTEEGLVLTHKTELDAKRANLDFIAGGAKVRRDGRDVILQKSNYDRGEG